MKRRDFLKVGAAGISALCVGDCVPWFMEGEAFAARKQLNFVITDAVKEMATNNTINSAQCYFWIYKDNSQTSPLPADCPGPHIFATTGDQIEITLTNNLDEPHNFFIPGVQTDPSRSARPIFDSGPIAPGATVTRRFRAPAAGTYMYHDSLNAPVNRVMGLHGAFISMPRAPRVVAGRAPVRRATPYGRPTPAVQRLFNELGSPPTPAARVGSAWWPGLSWESGDPTTNTPPFRQYIWLLHQASPNLFAKVGNHAPGEDYPAAQFVNEFLRDPLDPANPVAGANFTPQYFTINGQAGHFSHNTPYICPNNRVGEPVLIRMLNAGLWSHSMHIHANHVYVTFINEVNQIVPGAGQVAVRDEGRQIGVQTNPFWVDVFTINPMGVYDWLVPYHRPPDVPNARGVGRADSAVVQGVQTWPPNQELALAFPPVGAVAGATPIHVTLSPICYPMHDHSEPSQTSQGGNYNMGMIAGMNFIGDRNVQGGVQNFGSQPLVFPAGPDGVFRPAVDPPWFGE